MLSNFHTHSHYCDGQGELRDYVELAVANGFDALGFSGHGPVPFENKFSIKDDQYLNYCNEVRALKEEYKDRIDISLGLEIDYIPGMLEDFAQLIEKGGLEYVIGSVHLIPANDRPQSVTDLWFIDGPRQETYDNGLRILFGGDIRRGVKAYFRQQNEMIVRNHPTIVGHPDKVAMHNRGRYFSEEEPWYLNLAMETLSLIHEQGLICELNTRGIYKGRHPDYYPSRQLIKAMEQWRIPLLVSTDAHSPEDLLRTEGAYEYLHDIDYPVVLHSWKQRT
ncbi:MAG: histidinol-phosphatase [Bacteroidales bacterium]|nr:histidinol-phosphatase [Bacteroidales bacterium]